MWVRNSWTPHAASECAVLTLQKLYVIRDQPPGSEINFLMLANIDKTLNVCFFFKMQDDCFSFLQFAELTAWTKSAVLCFTGGQAEFFLCTEKKSSGALVWAVPHHYMQVPGMADRLGDSSNIWQASLFN